MKVRRKGTGQRRDKREEKEMRICKQTHNRSEAVLLRNAGWLIGFDFVIMTLARADVTVHACSFFHMYLYVCSLDLMCIHTIKEKFHTFQFCSSVGIAQFTPRVSL